MALILGIAMMLLAGTAFYYSLPGRGKAAGFVGTKWERYAVVAMICAMICGVASGAILILSGLGEWVQ